jgi:chromosome segregation ATPase
MDGMQQSVGPKRVKSLKRKLASLRKRLDSVTTEAHEVLAELSSQSEALQEENQQLAQNLEGEREEKKKLAECLKAAEGENQRLEGEKGQITQELESARQEVQVLADRLTSVEEEKQNLEEKNDRLSGSLRKLENKSRGQDQSNKKLKSRLHALEEEHKNLNRELETCRSDKDVLVREVGQIEEKAQRERLKYGLRFVRELSPILADLSDLSGLEPESVKGLKPRSVLEKLKAWVEQATGESPVPFPSKGEMQADHTVYLDPDEAGIEALMKIYDWQPDRPFEGFPVGKRRRRFRVLRRGWRVGENILIRVQVAVEDESGNAGE